MAAGSPALVRKSYPAVPRYPVIAALFVAQDGCYSGLQGVDPWPADRDARQYPGPWPVVAHPPCERWGNYWAGSPSGPRDRLLGDDGGCFKAALDAVRKYGGVLEHPARSRAWAAFGLRAPRGLGIWWPADAFGGWTCEIDQGHFGHEAAKATWLYARAPRLPAGLSYRGRARKQRGVENMGYKQRAATPLAFRDLLIGIAESVIG